MQNFAAYGGQSVCFDEHQNFGVSYDNDNQG